MPQQTTSFEYIDKAFGYNIQQAFESINPDNMPQAIKDLLLRGANKMIHIGSLEKQGAKAFKTMVEKRASSLNPIPGPLVVIHREVGSTNDKLDYIKMALQYKDLLQGFEVQVLPATFTFTIQLFGNSYQKEMLNILSMIINAWLQEHYLLKIPHTVNYIENSEAKQTEMTVPLDISKMDIDNASWTPVIEGQYLGIERGLDVNTKIIMSNMITPNIVDFNFLGVESL